MLTDARKGSLGDRLVSTRRVVVVEDDTDIADFLRAYFRASGYDFAHLDPSSVREAVAALAAQTPDAILLDLNLRGLQGQDVYAELRRDERFAGVPVIVVTALPRRYSGLDLRPGDDYVQKPFSVVALAETVEHHILTGAGVPLPEPDLDVLTRLDAAIADSQSGAGPVSLGLVRLDSSALIVRKAGHRGRRWVMEHLVRAFSSVLPERAAVGVTGDDEIAVVLPQTPTGAAAHVVQRAIDAINGSLTLPGGETVRVALSAGLATCPFHGTDVDTVYGAADVALADGADVGDRLRAAS